MEHILDIAMYMYVYKRSSVSLFTSVLNLCCLFRMQIDKAVGNMAKAGCVDASVASYRKKKEKKELVKGVGKTGGRRGFYGCRVKRVPHISHLLSDLIWWSNVAASVSFADLLARLMSGSDARSRARPDRSIGRRKWQVRHSPAGQTK